MRMACLVAACSLLVPFAVDADVYVWRDAQGGLKYSAEAPGAGAQEVRRLRTAAKFLCSFAGPPAGCGFRLQAGAPTRASIVKIGRDGRTGLRLRTEPGDVQIAGSGAMERADVYLSQADTGCYEGREQWWEHSILYPDDFVPSGGWGAVVFDFHNTSPGPGQANLEINVGPRGMNFSGYGGAVPYPKWRPADYAAPIGPVLRNVWYEFAYHVKWSSGAGGFFDAWVNGVHKLAYSGPTLYAGQGCYLKLANYHTPGGTPSSVIHGRVSGQDVLRP